MEYLDGQSLSRIIRTASHTQNSLPLPVHLRILIEVLEGLHYAHEMKAYDWQGRRTGAPGRVAAERDCHV